MKIAQTTTPASADSGTFRQMLQTELARRCSRNARYSLRAFAEQLGIDHSTLSQLLRERRPITERTIRLIGSRLKLADDVIEAFVVREKLAGDGSSESLGQVRQLTGDAASVVSALHHYTILELIRLKDFRPDSRWIARVLGLSVDEVNIALSRLLRLGLLEMTAHGKWHDKTGDASASLDGFTHVAIQQLMQQVRRLQAAAIRRVPANLRDHSSTTIAVDTTKLPLAVEMIRGFQRELSRCLRSDASADDVYQLEISLFPVTRIKQQETSHGRARHAVPNRVKKP